MSAVEFLQPQESQPQEVTAARPQWLRVYDPANFCEATGRGRALGFGSLALGPGPAGKALVVNSRAQASSGDTIPGISAGLTVVFIAEKYANISAASDFIFGEFALNSGDYNFGFYESLSGGNLAFYVHNGSSGVAATSSGEWTAGPGPSVFVATFGNGDNNVRLYRDGRQIASAAQTGNVRRSTSSTAVRLSGWTINAVPNFGFYGGAILNRRLPAEDVAQLFGSAPSAWDALYEPSRLSIPALAATSVSDPVGRSDETDAAVVLAGLQLRAAGLSVETDAALALAGLQARAVGLAAEADIAIALAAVQLRQAGRADETNAAIALAVLQSLSVGLAQEADAALALDPGAAGAVGVAPEQDSAIALPAVQVRTVGMAAEVDTALALYPFVGGSVGLALEIDTSRAMAGVQIRQVGMATESNTALALQPAAIGPALLGSLTGRMIRPGASRPAAASVGQRRNLQTATR